MPLPLYMEYSGNCRAKGLTFYHKGEKLEINAVTKYGAVPERDAEFIPIEEITITFMLEPAQLIELFNS